MSPAWAREELRVRPRVQRLSPHEERVLSYVAAGLTNRAVAGEIGVTVPSVESALARIYTKLEDARGGDVAWDRRVCAVLWWLGFTRPMVDVVEDL